MLEGTSGGHLVQSLLKTGPTLKSDEAVQGHMQMSFESCSIVCDVCPNTLPPHTPFLGFGSVTVRTGSLTALSEVTLMKQESLCASSLSSLVFQSACN